MSITAVREVTQKSSIIEGTYEGLPYIGPPIDLKDTDEISTVLKLNQIMHCKRFDLSEPKQLKEYEKVCQKIQDGFAQLSFEEREYDKENKQWVALVRWIDWWYSPVGEDKK